MKHIGWVAWGDFHFSGNFPSLVTRLYQFIPIGTSAGSPKCIGGDGTGYVDEEYAIHLAEHNKEVGRYGQKAIKSGWKKVYTSEGDENG